MTAKSSKASSPPPFLIPVKQWRRLPGAFHWPSRIVLASANPADQLPLRQLAQELQQQRPTSQARIEFNAAGPATVRIHRAPGGTINGAEAYRLDIHPERIEISAATDAGAFYAVQTLRELVRIHPAPTAIPACKISDEPDFPRRGVYLDCARGKMPKVAALKALIERLAGWKINELQLYIKNGFKWFHHPDIGRGYSPYSPADMLTLQEHCQRYHIRFVPSLATLSHNELTLQLPAYRHLAELPGALGWEGGTMLCPTNPKSIRLVEELYREFLPLFQADDMNVCCDEPWELGKGRSKTQVQRRGAGRVYLDFLLQLHKLCATYGKRMNVWGDIVLQYSELIPELPKDIVMLNWDYEVQGGRIARTREFSAAGIPVMACPGTQSWQRHGTDLPKAIGNVANFAATARACNAQGLLNTDWGDYGHRNPIGVSLHSYAHGAAHAWNGAAVDDQAFTERFTFQIFDDRDGTLAASLRALGGTNEKVSPDHMCLYHALVEPLLLPHTRFIDQFKKVSEIIHYPSHYPARIDLAVPESLARIIAELAPDNFRPPSGHTMPEFEQKALEDCRLAARLDTMAARRAQLGQNLRKGTTGMAKTLHAWSNDMRILTQDFAQNWLDRNRPGLLRDNLKLMRLATDEADMLARN